MASPKKRYDGVTRHVKRLRRQGKLLVASMATAALAATGVGGVLLATASSAAAASSATLNTPTIQGVCGTEGVNSSGVSVYANLLYQVTGSGLVPNSLVLVQVTGPEGANGSGSATVDSSGNLDASIVVDETTGVQWEIGHGDLTWLTGAVGAVSTGQVSIGSTCANLPSAPKAALSVAPSSGTAPLKVTADASASTGATEYKFDWGDGTPATGFQSANTANHTFNSSGSYTVTVTAKNSNGTDTASQVVKVTPPPPACKSDNDGSSQAYYSSLEWNGLSSYQAALDAAHPGDTITITGTVTVPGGCSTAAFNALYLQPAGTTALKDQQLLDSNTATYTAGTHQVSVSVTLPSSGMGNGQLCGSQKLQADSGVGPVITDFASGTYGNRKFANGFGSVTKDFGPCTTPPPPPTQVTAAAPSFHDVCGTANDTYTVPSTTGVEYAANGTTKAAGTYAGSGTVNITATASSGYVLSGTTSWSHTFTNEPCTTPPPPPAKGQATVTVNTLTCQVSTPVATTVTQFAASIGYVNPRSNEVTWAYREVKAGTHQVKLPKVAPGGTASWLIVVQPLDDSVGPFTYGPFNFERPNNCQKPPSTGTPQQPVAAGTDGSLPMWQQPVTWFALGGFIIVMMLGGFGARAAVARRKA